jgi:hypothetical protein
LRSFSAKGIRADRDPVKIIPTAWAHVFEYLSYVIAAMSLWFVTLGAGVNRALSNPLQSTLFCLGSGYRISRLCIAQSDESF